VKESAAKAKDFAKASVFDNVAATEQDKLKEDANVIVSAMKQQHVSFDNFKETYEPQKDKDLIAKLTEEIMQQEQEGKYVGVPKFMVNMLTYGKPRLDLERYFSAETKPS